MAMNRAKRKIAELVSRGVKTNVRRASDYTVGQIANASFKRQQPHSQRKEAINEVSRRQGTGSVYKTFANAPRRGLAKRRGR
jgi:hypothetical protein